MLTEAELKQQQAAFERSLAAFEQCVDTPFVPGELHRWLDAVAESLARLTASLAVQTKQVHSEEFADIAREDPGLLQRVAQMREEDRKVADQQHRLQKTIETLKPRVRKVGADEAFLRRDFNRLADESRKFVSRVRKQEVTVRTWWMEAFLRDRGTVD